MPDHDAGMYTLRLSWFCLTILRTVLQIFGALYLAATLGFAFAVNMLILHRARVNTALVFQYNKKSRLRPYQYFHIPAVMLLSLSVVFCATFSTRIGQNNGLRLAAGWTIGVFAFILNPLPILQAESRFWLIRTFCRVVTSGLIQVEQRDFWIGDELCSLSFTIYNLQCRRPKPEHSTFADGFHRLSLPDQQSPQFRQERHLLDRFLANGHFRCSTFRLPIRPVLSPTVQRASADTASCQRCQICPKCRLSAVLLSLANPSIAVRSSEGRICHSSSREQFGICRMGCGGRLELVTTQSQALSAASKARPLQQAMDILCIGGSRSAAALCLVRVSHGDTEENCGLQQCELGDRAKGNLECKPMPVLRAADR